MRVTLICYFVDTNVIFIKWFADKRIELTRWLKWKRVQRKEEEKEIFRFDYLIDGQVHRPFPINDQLTLKNTLSFKTDKVIIRRSQLTWPMFRQHCPWRFSKDKKKEFFFKPQEICLTNRTNINQGYTNEQFIYVWTERKQPF